MKRLNTVVATLVAVILLSAAGLGVYAWSGAYAIGADVPHWPITYDVLAYFRDRAIARHDASVEVPADLESPARLQLGAEHYAEMCTGCHLEPGESGDEIREGLYPTPPDFSRMKHPIDPRRAYWVIKHGIKFTAMPAWGRSHSDDKIWAMVAFVRKLPGMTPAQYKAYTARHRGDDDHDAVKGDAGTPAPASTTATPAGNATVSMR
jgi:mono/diheme cytochrome c family protein